MSIVTDDHFVREAAIVLLARDAVLGHDLMTAEIGVGWARKFMDAHEGSRHDGDCTKQPQTCMRCLCDAALTEAREVHDQ